MSDLLTLKSPFQKELLKGRFNLWKGGRVMNVARQQVNTVTSTQVIKITGSTQQLNFNRLKKKMCFVLMLTYLFQQKCKMILRLVKSKEKQ